MEDRVRAILDVSLFISIFQRKFEERMSNKTGWGKNEIMIEFEKAKSDTLMEVISRDLIQ